MAAYLLTWSPKRTVINEFSPWSEQVKNGKSIKFRWSCGRRQIIRKGDRVFLIRQGKEPKGIFGVGTVTRGSFQAKHWDLEKAKAGKKAWYVYAKYDILLDPEKDQILPRNRLDTPPFVGVKWNTQSSGIDIPDSIATELEKALVNLAGSHGANPLRDLKLFKDTYTKLTSTQREAVIQSRIGQGKFRSDLINYWKGCAITGCKVMGILKASHIKPWHVSNNRERLDLFNGILLVPNLDCAFDNGLISFEDDGRIMISKRLSKKEAMTLGIHSQMKLLQIESSHKKYLDYHRKNIFR